MKKINILLFSENLQDPVSFYRGMAPLIELTREYEGITLMTINGHSATMPEWSDLTSFDILYLQRPASGFACDLAKQAHLCQLKVIVEMDDLLTDVPRENPTWDYYSGEIVQEWIRMLLLRKEFMKIVSTPHLKKCFEDLGAVNIHVVPNALHTRLMDVPDFSYDPPQTAFSWRGSNTHELDLYQYKEQIWEAMPSVEYIGYRPATLLRQGRDKFTKPMPIMDYYYNLRYNHRSLFFVTLVDNDFNRSKSNILFLEATWAGGLVLAPAWEEWVVPGGVTYIDKEDFVVKAKMMQGWDMEERKRQWVLACNYIMDHLTLEKVNIKRYELIKSLL